MNRLAAAVSTAFLVFFSVLFGVRFSESFVRDVFKAQVTQPQISFLPDSYSQISVVLPGPDGNIWAHVPDDSRTVELGIARKIVRIRPDHTIGSSIPLKSSHCIGEGGLQVFAGKVWGELCGVQNNRWFSELVSIAPDGTITVLDRYDDSASGPSYAQWQWGIFPGSDGFLWIRNAFGSFKVSPDGQRTSFAITPPANLPNYADIYLNPGLQQRLTKGGDGNMWGLFEDPNVSGPARYYYGSVTPGGVTTVYPVPKPAGFSGETFPYPSSGPSPRLALGSDGNMWYSYQIVTPDPATNSYSVLSEIGKILPDGTMQTFSVPNDTAIREMTAGPDGNIWFSYFDARSRPSTGGIGKITPQGQVTLIPMPASYIPYNRSWDPYSSGTNITAGADGNIWFIASSSNENESIPYKIGKVALTSAAASSAPQGSSRSSTAVITGISSSFRSSSSAFSTGNRCGNGIMNTGEICDDGNLSGGDGCSASCTQEPGYSCSGSYCYQVCGDGIKTKGEQCDDNNQRSGDGCSAACLIEAAGQTVSSNSTLTPGSCGNGFSNTGEQCDDGNTRSGDGCSAQCAIEDGYSCYGTACATVCGDGKKRGGEDCDDANRQAGDGCSNYCRTEAGYTCIGTTCYVVCGDGVALGNEQCDDGNVAGGDGCSSNCRTEPNWVCGGRPTKCFYQAPSQPVTQSSSSVIPAAAVSSSSSRSSVVPLAASSKGPVLSSVASSAPSSDPNGPYFVPDWLIPKTSSSRSSAFSSSPDSSSESSSSDSSVSSSESSSSSSSSSSEESSSSSSEESSSSSQAACGNGIQDEGEECDAGSLNGSPVTPCSSACEFLKPAAGSSSSATSADPLTSERMNPFIIMILVALAVVLIGGIGAFVWMKLKKLNS